MKMFFYWKLAATGIYKNRKIYLPYILSCIGMVMMEYIIIFLATDKSVTSLPGGGDVQMFILMGVGIIAVFATFFLFYTNSFLMRRRKKEFGLYSILGMGRKNLVLVLFWESVIITLIALAAGIVFGVLFSKAAQIAMAYMLHSSAGFSLAVSPKAIQTDVTIFIVIFVLLFLNGLRQVYRAKPVELLKSENVGEKPPKANWVLAILGLIVLLAGYFLAITIEEPLSALLMFFVAVIFVIVGTYLLFIAGSVVLCRILKMNKRYYYKTSHFISISSMSYRMKRNGAGLAAICILSTAVLVMISSTASLYFGTNDLLNHRFTRQITMDMNTVDDAVSRKMADTADSILAEYGLTRENTLVYKNLDLSAALVGDTLSFDQSNLLTPFDYAAVRQLFVISLDDYNRLMGTDVTLAEDEILLYCTKTDYTGDTLNIEGYGTVKIKENLDSFMANGIDTQQVMASMFIFVPDLSVAIERFDAMLSQYGYDSQEIASYKQTFFGFDTNGDKDQQIAVFDRFSQAVSEMTAADPSMPEVSMECRASSQDSFMGLYSGLFFLGILLGIVCLCAAVLIMYYKQVTEGYEDQGRFDILQKVGMTRKEVSKIIHSQVLTVFFAPLIGAGIHIAVAFKIISLLLAMFGLYDKVFMAGVTLLCFVIFAVFYTLVYFGTSRAYYRIVSKG